MTAIVIMIGYDKAAAYGEDPMMMTLAAYSSVLGGWSEYCMCVMVLFFGFATVICWAHYGMECILYLSEKKITRYLFIAAYAAAMLWGAVSEPGGIWGAADFALGAMTLLNLCVVCPMSGEVVKLTGDYIRARLEKRSTKGAASSANTYPPRRDPG